MDNYVPLALPSKCKMYAGAKPENVKIRTLKGRDEQLIQELNIANAKKKVITLLEAILKGVPVTQLTTGDVKHILLWEVINSYSQTIKLSFTCENCSELVEQNIDMGTINSVELPDDFISPLSVTLSDNHVIKVRLPNLADEIAASEFAAHNNSVYLYSMALTIEDSELKNVMSKMLSLEELPVKDIAKIKEVYKKYEHGPDMLAKYTCSKCGAEGRVLVPFRLEDFI